MHSTTPPSGRHIACPFSRASWAGAPTPQDCAPVILWYRDEIGLTLQGAGFADRAAGSFCGHRGAAHRTGDRPHGGCFVATGYGSLLLVAGGLALAVLASPVAIFGARLFEAMGYLVVCISLPAILNENFSPAALEGTGPGDLEAVFCAARLCNRRSPCRRPCAAGRRPVLPGGC